MIINKNNLKFCLKVVALSGLAGQLAFSGIIHPNYTLDVYKSKQVTAEAIDKKFNQKFERIASMMLAAKTMPTPENSKQLGKEIWEVLQDVNKSGKFIYASMVPVIYPGGDKIGISIDLVDKGDEWRLQGFLPKPSATLADPKHLISDWQRYEKSAFDIVMRSKIIRPYKHCPAFHCIFGYELPDLKSYGEKFIREVPKHKNQLVDILRNDKEELKRSAAAYLLAHLTDVNEVVDVLTPSMRDSSSSVRNSVMRVLGGAGTNKNILHFPIDDAIRALDYPAATDRNKALYMLQSITTVPKYANYVREKGCLKVMEQFRMVQPNLHDTAYSVLVNISGKHYAVADTLAWQDWASRECQLTPAKAVK